MRFKLLLFTLLCSLAAILPAKANTLTVYDQGGTTTNQFVPIYGYWADNYLKSEFVIPAEKLDDMTGGTISQLKWYMSSHSDVEWTSTFKVFVKEVPSSTISTFMGESDATVVYEGPIDGTTFTLTVDFTQPYVYNGGNLLVGVYNTTKGGPCSSQGVCFFNGETVSGASVQGQSASGLNNISPNQRNFIPKTTFVYTPAANPKPSNLTVRDITAFSASAYWKGNENIQSYNLRYRKAAYSEIPFFDDFENGLGNWTIYTDGEAPQANGWYPTNPTSGLDFNAHSGSNVASSWSWTGGVAYNANNWLITPQVTFGNNLKFWVRTLGNWPDSYEVLLSTGGNAEEDFTVTLQAMAAAPTNDQWNEVNIDLSAYKGQAGYIAIHHVSYDANYLVIDDFGIYGDDFEAGEWITIVPATVPQPITDLDPDTEYEVQVQAVYADATTDWTNSVKFTTLAVDATPTDLTVTDITDCTATANWNGSQDSYNLRYRKLVLASDFEDSSIGGWTTIDADGDGYNWVLGSAVGGVYLDEGASMAGSGHSPQDLIVSGSFTNEAQAALTPDNYLVSPKVQLGGTITFWAKGQDANYAAEKFGVAVSTTGNTNAADFTMVGQTQTATADWVQYEFDLSAYAGQEGYVAIRHYDITDMFILNIDDITISSPGSNWVTVPNVTSPNTIEGLYPESLYEVQVQGVLGSGTTDWTNSVFFTTLEQQAIEASLAYIETFGQGICGDLYTITDQLIAIDYNDGYNDDVYLWCKDQNASVHATQPKDGQVDFMQQQGAQSGNWDQSNWVVLMISGENAHSIAESAKGHYLTGVTGIYVDDNNYMIEVVDNNFTISEETATYTPNVYCTANFINSNLTFDEESEGAHSDGDDETSYFFMNPKIQEYCTITWAQWNADKGYFVAPDNTGFDGAFNVSWDFNALGSIGGTLVDGELYSFNAIVQLTPIKNSTAPDETYIVYPMDLSSDSQIPTAINTVNANGEVVGVEYVNSLGVVSKTPFQGVNIVVTRYSDGSATTSKKIFK